MFAQRLGTGLPQGRQLLGDHLTVLAPRTRHQTHLHAPRGVQGHGGAGGDRLVVGMGVHQQHPPRWGHALIYPHPPDTYSRPLSPCAKRKPQPPRPKGDAGRDRTPEKPADQGPETQGPRTRSREGRSPSKPEARASPKPEQARSPSKPEARASPRRAKPEQARSPGRAGSGDTAPWGVWG